MRVGVATAANAREVVKGRKNPLLRTGMLPVTITISITPENVPAIEQEKTCEFQRRREGETH